MKIAKGKMRKGGLKRQLREEEMVSNFKNEDVKRRKDSGTFIVDGQQVYANSVWLSYLH